MSQICEIEHTVITASSVTIHLTRCLLDKSMPYIHHKLPLKCSIHRRKTLGTYVRTVTILIKNWFGSENATTATQEQQSEVTHAHDHEATYPQGDTEGRWVVCAWSSKFHHL